ncbi:four helix bundle protein [Alkaliphilus pronyensis]|uniref:Four helix bundle protein n=1 Tax=Alkaliphilus pronyensis TaxID=1482732 RepID=A0A6I0FBP6_9FIRM|nr:four helix bundle protein [Alkaliphilus pronyensis]KAB3539675.1 four helix bundle protein [Alkaliphilus pronyensis]
MSKNIISDKSFEFSIKIVKLCKRLYKDKEYVLSHQLLKSGTSIGANIEEAQYAQSKKDFISKLVILSTFL